MYVVGGRVYRSKEVKWLCYNLFFKGKYEFVEFGVCNLNKN